MLTPTLLQSNELLPSITRPTKVSFEVEEIGWLYLRKLEEVSQVYRKREFSAALMLASSATKMANLPDYILAQLLLLLALLGINTHRNAADAIRILSRLYNASPTSWSEERNEAFEWMLVVAEIYRTAVGGRNRSRGLEWAIRKAGRGVVEQVEELMRDGYQYERGDMILDAHVKFFEVVGGEMEISIEPRRVVATAIEQLLEQSTEPEMDQDDLDWEQLEMEQMEMEQLELEQVVLEQVKED